MQFFDPIITAPEAEVLTTLHVEIITENEMGKRTAVTPALFFMPHCDLPLYNNLLWANWRPECLCNVALLGNSLDFYHRSTASSKLQQRAWYVFAAHALASETMLQGTFAPSEVRSVISMIIAHLH